MHQKPYESLNFTWLCSMWDRCGTNGLFGTFIGGKAPSSEKCDNCWVKAIVPSSTTVTITHIGSKERLLLQNRKQTPNVYLINIISSCQLEFLTLALSLSIIVVRSRNLPPKYAPFSVHSLHLLWCTPGVDGLIIWTLRRVSSNGFSAGRLTRPPFNESPSEHWA